MDRIVAKQNGKEEKEEVEEETVEEENLTGKQRRAGGWLSGSGVNSNSRQSFVVPSGLWKYLARSGTPRSATGVSKRGWLSPRFSSSRVRTFTVPKNFWQNLSDTIDDADDDESAETYAEDFEQAGDMAKRGWLSSSSGKTYGGSKKFVVPENFWKYLSRTSMVPSGRSKRGVPTFAYPMTQMQQRFRERQELEPSPSWKIGRNFWILMRSNLRKRQYENE